MRTHERPPEAGTAMSRRPPTAHEIAEYRANFLAWIQWYEDNHKKEVPTQAALAARIGVSEAAVSLWRKAGEKRLPDFRSLVGAARMIGQPIDHMLRTRPEW